MRREGASGSQAKRWSSSSSSKSLPPQTVSLMVWDQDTLTGFLGYVHPRRVAGIKNPFSEPYRYRAQLLDSQTSFHLSQASMLPPVNAQGPLTGAFPHPPFSAHLAPGPLT